MDRIEAEHIGRQDKNVAKAVAAFRELESKLQELGHVSTADLRVYGVLESDLAPAMEKIFQIQKMAATSEKLVAKEHFLESEKQELIGQSSTFSSSASYIDHILRKREDAARTNQGDLERYRTSESGTWIAVKNVAKDIQTLLDELAVREAQKYSFTEIKRLRSATEGLVKQAQLGGHERAAALAALQETLSVLRKDALASLDERN